VKVFNNIYTLLNWVYRLFAPWAIYTLDYSYQPWTGYTL